MSNNKQSSVDWLVNELELYYIGESKLVHYEIIEQAKEMEKEQIIKAHLCMDIDGYFHQDMEDGEIYYNENYKEK